MPSIGPNGAWTGLELRHYHDASLASGLAVLFRGRTVSDFGCGNGSYVKALRASGVDIHGYDGNPHTKNYPSCEILDLSIRFDVGVVDWALSLEVGEHIPKRFEDVFLDNLHRHNRRGVVLSWAVPGQSGDGHVNCQSNEYVRTKMSALGYKTDLSTEWALRVVATIPWFKNTLMVFRR